ncbi:MAG TPA: acylphosphatase [Gammaproteobacteria bacterium]|nr:acylphosphatase [Gammaproteobacteria bacterium]
MSEKTVHCFVRGRVQGVSFRVHTLKAAQQLGLTGWVRNLSDGRVEMKVRGDDERVDRLLDWLPKGVPSGLVDSLETDTIASEAFEGFAILPDGGG